SSPQTARRESAREAPAWQLELRQPIRRAKDQNATDAASIETDSRLASSSSRTPSRSRLTRPSVSPRGRTLRCFGLHLSVYLNAIRAVVTELSRSPPHKQRRSRRPHHAQNRRRTLRRIHAGVLCVQSSRNQEQGTKERGADQGFHAGRASLLSQIGTARELEPQHTSHPAPRQQISPTAHLPRHLLREPGTPRVPHPRREATGWWYRASRRARNSVPANLGAPFMRSLRPPHRACSLGWSFITRERVRTISRSASSAATPPSPPDDTSNTASSDSPDHTRRHPPPPAGYGPHPTATFAPSRCASPTSPAPPLWLPRGSASAPDTPSPYPRHTPRKSPYR